MRNAGAICNAIFMQTIFLIGICGGGGHSGRIDGAASRTIAPILFKYTLPCCQSI